VVTVAGADNVLALLYVCVWRLAVPEVRGLLTMPTRLRERFNAAAAPERALLTPYASSAPDAQLFTRICCVCAQAGADL
jgi:hypothetical protein